MGNMVINDWRSRKQHAGGCGNGSASANERSASLRSSPNDRQLFQLAKSLRNEKQNNMQNNMQSSAHADMSANVNR